MAFDDTAPVRDDLLQKILRLEPIGSPAAIELDDWRSAKDQLPPLASADFYENKSAIAEFFRSKVAPRHRFYTPAPSLT
jgi:hypothetical protein